MFLQITDNTTDFKGMQATLNEVFHTMLANCSELIGLSQGIAAFAALWYIGSRIWKHMLKPGAIDLYPLFRPLAISIVILLFPALIATFNSVLEPTETGTAALVNDANKAVGTLLQQRQDAIEHSTDWQMYVGADGYGDLSKWEDLSGQADSGIVSGLSDRLKFKMSRMAYNMKSSVKVWLSQALELVFESAALCINTVRIFYLVVLAIFGPLAFALSTFDGFHSIIPNWLAHYIRVFLWLPIANIFGSLIAQVQQVMIKADLAQLSSSGHTVFGQTDAAYLIFLIMGIAGYFTVPSLSNYIVSAGAQGTRILKPSLGKWFN